ncbi:MAG: hypothetical protein V4736_10630, partial [Bdellovibrionota bacterium]
MPTARAQTETNAKANVNSQCLVGVEISEAISAATLDLITRAEAKAQESNCNAILLRINTPGGALNTTRLIVEKILASQYVYLCLITPSGGHAGSAGAIILQACHVNGGVKGTNVGAATPILSTGGETPSDLRNKMINDTVSWLDSITKLRKRNSAFARSMVTEAKAYSSEEAQKKGALDYFVSDEAEFLQKTDGKIIALNATTNVTLKTAQLNNFDPGMRHRVFAFLADPEIAYLLLMGSVGLLYFELTHPGLIAPGVVGGIGLIFSLMALHKLDVYWGGVALMFLGLVLLGAELFLPRADRAGARSEGHRRGGVRAHPRLPGESAGRGERAALVRPAH